MGKCEKCHSDAAVNWNGRELCGPCWWEAIHAEQIEQLAEALRHIRETENKPDAETR